MTAPILLGRRAVLIGGLAALAGCAAPRSSAGVTSATMSAPERISYGPDDQQWLQLYRPTSQVPVRPGLAVVIHGGFWYSQYGAELGAPLAADLASRGWTAANLEYRRLGSGGGWPNTLADVAAAIDKLAGIDGLDLHRVVAIGHSAGGQLATWAAHRPRLAAGLPGADPRVSLSAVIAQAGVLDLAGAARAGVGGSAVTDLLGGLPDQVPERYAAASPQQQLPLNVPVRCLHSPDDRNVPYSQSVNYVEAAQRAGADASLIRVPGDHFALIDTSTPAWQAVLELLPALLG